MTDPTRVWSWLLRYSPYVLAVVMCGLLVTVAPQIDSTPTRDAAVSVEPEPAGALGAAASSDDAWLDGAEDAATGETGVGSDGDASSVPGSAAGGGTGSAQPTSRPSSAHLSRAPGVGSPEALSAPDCDRASGRIRISYTWRPACVVPWPVGADNRGSTYQGVTGTSIRVVRYNDPIQPVSAERMRQQWQTSIDLFERFYRMWGRKVENIVVEKSGDDEVAQRADAVKIASLKPFVAIGIPPTKRVLITELANRKIVVITNANVTVELSTKLAPYVWGVTIQPDELVALNAGVYAGRRLVGLPARWAGQPDYRVQERRFGLVHPQTLPPSHFSEVFARYGGQLVEAIAYPSGQEYAAVWGERAQVIAARLKARGVTTVVMITDLLFTGPLTHAAAGQNWFPEWVTTGYLAQDLSIVASTYNQAQWRNAFGVAGIPIASGPRAPWPQYWFYQWYWGNTDDQNGEAHSEATVLFSGIHGAGPNLNPHTFRDGVFALPPSGGGATGGIISAQHSFGRHGFFPWDDYNAFDDFSEVYWDGTAVAPDLVTGQNTAGHYRHLNGGRRYTVDQWPRGEPAMFQPGGTAIYYHEYPPADRPPAVPCPADCPSRR